MLLLDRYEIGERQTSACAAPTDGSRCSGLERSIRQTFDRLVLHTPHGTVRFPLPWTFSTFDYPPLCELLDDQNDARVRDRQGRGARATRGPGLVGVRTDRGEVTAPLVVDALGWRRVLGADGYQPPDAPLSRGLEVHPGGSSGELEIWIDRSIVPAGYGWSFPAAGEVRVGVGSFDPRFHVKEPTVDLAERLQRDAVRYQGNWIPHRLRPAAEDDIFFAGDSAGHCLPLTAEGIRTAFYFGIALGRELRAGRSTAARRATTALRRYAAFSAEHEWKFGWMLRAQRLVPTRAAARCSRSRRAGWRVARFTHWAFDHYLEIAHPDFAASPRAGREPTAQPALASDAPDLQVDGATLGTLMRPTMEVT